MTARRLVEESATLLDGPWEHRDVSANGVRLHIAELGTGPLVVLLHGFPQFWWAWRQQIVDLAGAGFRVVAPDLRGYAASDKPPRGYDALTQAADIAGLVRAIGERTAVVVGHGWGGHVAWTLAAVHPGLVRRLAVITAPHPLRWGTALRDPAQQRSGGPMLRFQLPWHPERWLVADDADNVGRLLERWGGPGYPEPAVERQYRTAMQILAAPHCALEPYRWAFRSIPRSDGRRFRRAVRRPIDAPTLQLHGSLDRCTLARTASGSGRYVAAAYEWRLLEGVGHFPHEEAPDAVSGELVRWCKEA
ncbi:MAG TPA: alpha/beta hydrolase [Mycobacteriales bacterium]|nr:alpha/beta hydrolase [Mycobacteriales bacterium]